MADTRFLSKATLLALSVIAILSLHGAGELWFCNTNSLGQKGLKLLFFSFKQLLSLFFYGKLRRCEGNTGTLHFKLEWKILYFRRSQKCILGYY